MEQHLKAFFLAVLTWIAAVTVWLPPKIIAWLPTIDFLMRIALSGAGLVTAYYSARYYKRNTPKGPS